MLEGIYRRIGSKLSSHIKLISLCLLSSFVIYRTRCYHPYPLSHHNLSLTFHGIAVLIVLCYDIGNINLFDFLFWMAKQIYNFILWWEKKRMIKFQCLLNTDEKSQKKWMDFLYKSKLFSFPFLFYLPLSWKRAKREILESFQYQPSLFCPTAILAKTISFSIEPFHPGECRTREWERKTSQKSFRNSSTFTDLKNQKLIYCWL